MSNVGWGLLQIIGRLSRLSIEAPPAVHKILDQKTPAIFVFWHRYQLLMAWEHRNKGVTVLVSRSRDGELIARVVEKMGFKTARGSSSRGGPTAFRALMSVLEAGGQVAVTPDGPRGPLRSVQPGVLALAVKTGAPVVPVAWAGTRVKKLSSWDEFLMPLPLGRFRVVYGDPVFVTAPDAAAEQTVREALCRVERLAAGEPTC